MRSPAFDPLRNVFTRPWKNLSLESLTDQVKVQDTGNTREPDSTLGMAFLAPEHD